MRHENSKTPAVSFSGDIAWLTDLHLNCVNDESWQVLETEILTAAPSYLVVSGDISESENLLSQVDRLSKISRAPLIFVLGNHDFYGSDVDSVRSYVSHFCQSRTDLFYLPESGPILLPGRIAMVGTDGWGDAKLGDYLNSPIKMADFDRIDDLKDLTHEQRRTKLQELGEASANTLSRQLAELPQAVSDILVVTHVPPFREACWYMGKTTDDTWAPFFTCDSVGKLLTQYADEHSDQCLWVLCGHTHHAGIAQIRNNLRVLTGAAEYGHPRIEKILSLSNIEDSFSE